MQPSEIISVNLWQIVVSLLNLFLLFLILKKFLFAPVTKALNTRQANIDSRYEEADKALLSAKESEAQLKSQLESAHVTADEIVKDAVALSERRKEKLLSEAKDEADGIIRQARAEIELERKKAEGEIKAQIADVSSMIAEKLMEKELKEEDHRRIIDSLISEIGDGSHEE